MHDLDPGMLVAADMTIGRFLPHLREARFGVPRFYFVLDSHAISGLVTRADLNKEAARAHFYLKIAAFELVLSTVVRAAYPDDAFLGLLDKGTTLKLETRYRRAMHSDVQVTKAAYLDFRDLLAIVRATPASLRALGIATVSEWDASTSKVAQLRDRVFHTPRNMIDEKLTIDDLVDLDQRLSSLIDRPQNVIAW
jgi:hypothetical protein